MGILVTLATYAKNARQKAFMSTKTNDEWMENIQETHKYNPQAVL